ncbi:MAG TPA: hypothetical protein VM285_13820, partial [Polyangia bacterium]|nr:hypothetical protein [Polyangia bacterium]
HLRAAVFWGVVDYPTMTLGIPGQETGLRATPRSRRSQTRAFRRSLPGIGAPGRDYSLSRQSVGFGVALIPNLVLGARLTMAFVNMDDDFAEDPDLFVMGVSPYLEYVFLDGTWRPFVTGVVGTEGWFGEIGNDDYWLASFVGGAGGGLHVFIVPQFSIDATALFTFAVGGGEWDTGRGDDDIGYHSIEVGVLLGLSGWL